MVTKASEIPERHYYRKLLSRELSNARDAADMTQKQVAEELAWSISKIVRIEQGGVGVAPSDVRAIGSLLGLPESKIGDLVDYAHSERKSSSWQEYSDLMSSGYQELISLEPKAARIFKYESGLIPGLVQTEDYMRALFKDSGVSSDDAERQIDIRLLRQTMLQEDECPELNFVIGELALVRRAGSAEVMVDQIRHLAILSQSKRITLLVMPISEGVHSGMGVPFTILQFRENAIEDTLYTDDGMQRTSAEEDADTVDSHLATFRSISEKAEESGKFEVHAERILRDWYGVEMQA